MHFTEHDTRLTAYAVVTRNDPRVRARMNRRSSAGKTHQADYSLPPMQGQRILSRMRVTKMRRGQEDRLSEALGHALQRCSTMRYLAALDRQ